MDLDTTADVHDEHTADLTPSTVDIVPADVPRPTLAGAVSADAPHTTAANAAPANAQNPTSASAVPANAPRTPTNAASESVSATTPTVARVVEPVLARASEPVVDAPIVAKPREPIVAKPAEPPIEPSEPIVARVERAPLPFGRREPFVSAPPATTAAPAPAALAATPMVAEAPAAAAPRASKVTSTSVTEDVGGESVKATTTIPRVAAPLKAAEKQRPALAPGAVLSDRYLLEQVIGCGGTAIVFRARDMLSAKGTAPNIQVAIKTPRPELGDPERAAKRLKHEFEHAKLLSHPSIVRVHELHEDEGRSFMTMELVQGKLLSQLLRDWTMVPPALAHKILSQCAEALQYAHSQNVVHGDFKPGNVFITPDEGVRIVDFGTAAGPSTNESRIPAGTPTYASPEVLSGETPDARDDVFSFACVAYELLTGQHPFGRQSSSQARDEGKIPPRAWNLSTSQWLSLLSALSWKREQRPTGVEDLLTRLSPERPVATAPAPVHADPEEVVPAELPADLMPKQRSWGFFAFIACALLVTYFAFQRQNAADDDKAPTAPIAPATLPPAPTVMSQPAPAETTAAPTPEPETATVAPEATKAPVTAAKPKTAAPMSEISFESSSIVTSESSVAAVFLIKRSQPLTGRVSVSWKAISGTADAGIDFASGASGTVTFADGQAQRAIYVPLRNDLLKEDDETFYVELVAPKSARLGKVARAQAIIRDDD